MLRETREGLQEAELAGAGNDADRRLVRAEGTGVRAGSSAEHVQRQQRTLALAREEKWGTSRALHGTFTGFSRDAMQLPSAAEAVVRGTALAARVELVPFPVCLDVGTLDEPSSTSKASFFRPSGTGLRLGG